MRIISFFCVLLFTIVVTADTKLLTIENVYASSEDYNVTLAKEKAFNSALARAISIVSKQENLDPKLMKWKLVKVLKSYQIQDEKIEDKKYSAFFDFSFDKEKLLNLTNVRSSNNGNELARIIYHSQADNKIFIAWIKGLSEVTHLPVYSYENIEQIYSNDIIVTHTNSKFHKRFVISIELGSSIINFSADSLQDYFLPLLENASEALQSVNIHSKNFIVMSSVPRGEIDLHMISEELSKYVDLEEVKIIAYQKDSSPVYLLKLAEKDDLLLSYVYNNNDYQLSDLRIFEQILEPL